MQSPRALVHDAQIRLDAAGIESPRLEAQLLLALSLNTTRTAIVAETCAKPTLPELVKFEELLQQREKHVPFAYLRGTQEFYGLTFHVAPAVLIPRPETELLVDFVLEQCKANPTLRFADVGTGSGCIPIAVLSLAEEAQAIAIDISAAALRLAKANAQLNGMRKRLRFVRGSLLNALASDSLDGVVSNPPYISSGELACLQPEVRDHEPRLALDGGADGLNLIRALTAQAKRALKSGGWLAMEVAQGQAEAVRALFQGAGFVDVETRADLAGIARIVTARKS